MSKYSNEFKLKVVKYCLDEHHSTRDAAKRFSIPAHSMIINWIRKYEEHGVEGLVKQFKSSYRGRTSSTLWRAKRTKKKYEF